jgi:hypothetical protein
MSSALNRLVFRSPTADADINDALILYLRQLSAGSELRLFPVGNP